MAAPTESLAQLVLRCTGSPLLGLVAELEKHQRRALMEESIEDMITRVLGLNAARAVVTGVEIKELAVALQARIDNHVRIALEDAS